MNKYNFRKEYSIQVVENTRQKIKIVVSQNHIGRIIIILGWYGLLMCSILSHLKPSSLEDLLVAVGVFILTIATSLLNLFSVFLLVSLIRETVKGKTVIVEKINGYILINGRVFDAACNISSIRTHIDIEIFYALIVSKDGKKRNIYSCESPLLIQSFAKIIADHIGVKVEHKK